MNERGQLVLVASVLVAVALAPVVLAYLQLGYHDDVRATGEYDDPAADTVRSLDRAVTRESADVAPNYAWDDRGPAVTAFRRDLAPVVSRLENAELQRGAVTNISYNGTAVRGWQAANCPRGPDRQFGDCERDRGVVVQDRVDRTHILAVGFDVRMTSQRSRTTVTVVLRAQGER